MNEWKNEWKLINEWMNENEWMKMNENEWMNEWMNEWNGISCLIGWYAIFFSLEGQEGA